MSKVLMTDAQMAIVAEALAALRKTEPVAWTASLDEVRDNILNGRGPLESVLNNDQTNAVLSVFDELYAAPAREPTHRYQCCDCGRKSWDESDELSHCNFPQPNGKRCAGQMLPIAPSRESRTDHQEPELSAEQIEYIRNDDPGNYIDENDWNTLCDMALESLRGTFADGVEAAAKAAHDALRDIDRAHAEIAYSAATSALAQGQRESNSNPAPMHGQSKTGLTESHSGAPTQEADDLLRGLRRKLFRGGITAADWDVIDAYLSRKEQ